MKTAQKPKTIKAQDMMTLIQGLQEEVKNVIICDPYCKARDAYDVQKEILGYIEKLKNRAEFIARLAKNP